MSRVDNDKTVEVSQAARDAAGDMLDADHRLSCDDAACGSLYALRVRAGKEDGSPFVQAFARFEAATRATQPEAAIQDLLASIDAWAIDPSADAEQRILDARAALQKDPRHG